MLETLGYDDATAAAFARWEHCADAVLGRVASTDEPGVALALTAGGPVRATWGGGLLADVCADPLAAPAAGDWGVLRTWPDHRVTLERVLPRSSAVVGVPAEEPPVRPGERHVLAANVDLAALVVAADGPARPDRLAAALAVLRASGVRPLVVLSRADRVADAAAAADAVRRTLPDADVLAVSGRTGVGVEALRDRAEGRLALGLVGAPGQGRSRLARALAGNALPGHRLLMLPGGGLLVDAPSWRLP